MSSAGGITAKVKSMYAKHLRKEQYEELLRKKTVAQIAGYLKNETRYADALQDVREKNIHRGQLENMLRQDMFKQTAKIYHYANAAQKKFYWLHMQPIEIDLLLSRIRVINSQEFEDAIAEFPVFLKAYTCFDMIRLGNVHTFHELLEVVKDTWYYEILLPFRPGQGKETMIDYTAIETALEKRYYINAFRTIKQVLKGAEARRVRAFYMTKVDLTNITKIYRYKRFFHANEEVIKRSLIDIPGYTSSALMEKLISEKHAEGIVNVLQGTKYPLKFKNDELIEDATDRIFYDLAKKYFYHSQEEASIFISYLVLLSRELTNIINIIEGIRYQVHSDDIEMMLFY